MSSVQGTQDIYQRVPRGSLTEGVVYQIEELVLSGELRQGDKLPSQRDLAARLGVSPTVVREAVRILEQKGLLDARAGSGTYVSALTPEACSDVLRLLFKQGAMSFDHLYEAREVLEIEIAGMAAARAKPDHIEQMDAAILRMDQSRDDLGTFVQADFELHLALARATDNPVFPLLTVALLEAVPGSRKFSFQVPGATARGQAYHRAIRDSVKRGDVEGAREAMREHLEQSRADSAAGQARIGDIEEQV